MREDEADISVDAEELAPPVSFQPRGWWWFISVVVIAVDLVGIYHWIRRTPEVAPTKPATELLSNLVRLDGRLCVKDSTNTFTGWMISRYADGSMKSRSHVSNGLLEGVSEGWFANGVRQVEEHFVAGLSEGSVTHWREDGSKLSEGYSQSGKLEGLFRRWHTNGVLAEEIHLVSGQPDGLARSWHPSGSLKAEATLREGQVIHQVFHESDVHDRRTNLLAQGGVE